METLVNVILILNVGTGMAPKIAAEQYVKNIGDNLSERINAKERGVEIVAIACPNLVGCRVEIIPLKALIEGKYVLKEEIKLPEMEEVLAILKKFEEPNSDLTLMDSSTGD